METEIDVECHTTFAEKVYTGEIGDFIDNHFNFKPTDIIITGVSSSGREILAKLVWLLLNNLDFTGAKTSIDKRVPTLEVYFSSVYFNDSYPFETTYPNVSLTDLPDPRIFTTEIPIKFLPQLDIDNPNCPKEVSGTPLCVFSLSPAFVVYDCSHAPNWTSRCSSNFLCRRNDISLPKNLPRFKPMRRRYSQNILAKYLTGQVKNRYRGNLTLQEVLNTIKSVWSSPDGIINSVCSHNMDNLIKKKSSASSELQSPILFRRRLSAPETIMRKHTLAQQRSESHDSDSYQGFDTQSCQWRIDNGIGSDPNLNKKRDYNLMRKSTLLRRLWGSTKPLSERNSKFPTTYYEWQCGKVIHDKSTHSLCSNHSSPEHAKNRIRTSGSEEIKFSPTHKYNKSENLKNFRYQMEKLKEPISSDTQSSRYKSLTSNKGVDFQNNQLKMCSEYSQTSFEVLSSCDSRVSTTKNSTTTDLESEQYTTRSTSTGSTTCTTTFSENSETTYSNNSSNFSTTDTFSNTYSSEMFLEENGNNKNNENSCIDIQGNYITNLKKSNLSPFTILDNFNDSSTQTIDPTNVNVISNVQLSQSTLNLIFNKVMQDVQESNINTSVSNKNIPLEPSVEKSITHSKLIQVQQVPSFYLKQKEESVQTPEQQRILKYMVSNIGVGSPYRKPSEKQVVVPRFSALPQSTSMEVNISSGESSDRESDKISLMDSLEDENSPRFSSNKSTKFDEKPVRGEISPLLPDNSEDKFEKAELKSSAFFIPIKSTAVIESTAVADHLPEKVKERLHKRQLKREQKLKVTKFPPSSKSDSNYVSASDNGNYPPDSSRVMSTHTLPDINLTKVKRKMKSTLPNIKSVRKIKMETDAQQFPNKKNSKQIKRKTENKSQNAQELKNIKKHESLLTKTRHKLLEPLSSVYSSKNYVYDVIPKRILHKTQVNNLDKRIEILEIVECVGSSSDSSQRSKSKKSKIPVFVNSKLPNISKEEKNQKPIFLDFDHIHEDDSKVDQLIANILIDALNRPDTQGSLQRLSQKQINVNESRPLSVNLVQSKHQVNKYHQIFESIPEEKSISHQSSLEESVSNVINEVQDQKESNLSQSQKTVLQGLKSRGNFVKADVSPKSPSKGWITFYSVHKGQGSSENTSDEGTKGNLDKDIKNNNGTKLDESFVSKPADFFKYPESTNIKNQMANNQVSSKEKSLSQDSVDTWTSSDQEKCRLPSSVPNYRNQQRKERYRNSDSSSSAKSMPHGWTVTVTGSTSNGQFVPELQMHLKFPSNCTQNNPASQSDSGFGEENERREILPNIMPRKETNTKSRVSTTENVQKTQQLPKLIRHKSINKLRQNENVYPITDSIEPRQTKTSSRRLLLNRPRTLIPPNDFFEDDLNDQSFQEILKKFPDILKIRGSAISPERKPKVSSMTERDIARHIYSNT